MTRLLTAIILILPALVSAQESPAPVAQVDEYPQQMSAEDLLATCAASSLSSAGRQRRKYCSGFISGVEEGVRVLQAQKKIEATICLPEGVSARALAEVYRRHAARHRQGLDRPAAVVVLEALSERFPCDE